MVYSQFQQIQDRGDLDFNQTSQELRVASPKGGFFDYVAGMFYIKAKTAEKLGFAGRGEGIVAEAVVLIDRA